MRQTGRLAGTIDTDASWTEEIITTSQFAPQQGRKGIMVINVDEIRLCSKDQIVTLGPRWQLATATRVR